MEYRNCLLIIFIFAIDNNPRYWERRNGMISKVIFQKNITESSYSLNTLRELDSSEKIDCNETCQIEVQKYRRILLRDQCASLGYNYSFDYQLLIDNSFLRKLNHFIVLDKYRVIYSYIPKAGCTNWKRVFLVLHGVVNTASELEQHQTHELTDKYIRKLSSYTVEEAARRLQTYKIFTFVRNPFVRLLSAYKDKIEKPTGRNLRYRKEWSHRIPINMADGITQGPDTFVQYVKYLSHYTVINEHWKDMHKLSLPCHISFDFIGKLETLKRDTEFVMYNILETKPEIVTFRSSTNPTNSNQLVENYLSKLSEKETDELFDQMKLDFRLFGYEMPQTFRNIQNESYRT
ncbi:carbohydrate sulfotransferase 9-like isoform X3 [Apostichopus japonicus]|uniref:carbohydrate sulfotransferase 9-like isoform X3 n=1 Tax=Stichopus japonicus TaxID=307972 RepID=UPI003AB61720